ncbi:cysteine-rich receptor-like protein kinase 25 [Gastrolobium bilobum]|uniref:cysteine-rich receptor-like protein kinase 25 n=1 Tax=Gastrolobium bilobum TaxID=150636 RepID=UPI002AAF2CC7|nr:cysteine-rich receptor-like protein kinase 25 [Gastrolobium bilobum]
MLRSIIFSLAFFNHTPAATSISSYLPPPYYNCSINNTYEPNSTYNTNLETLLSWLSSDATNTSQIYSTSIVEGSTSSDTIYGLFMCTIGDGDPNCKDCVINSAKVIKKLYPMAKEAMLWADNCFMRYSNHYFFTTVEEIPKLIFMNEQDYGGQVGQFNSILWETMDYVIFITANAPSGIMKYGYKLENITAKQMLYAMGYCILYLSYDNCCWCLSDAIAEIPTSCCRAKIGGRVIYPTCGVRYELYPFYHSMASAKHS